MVAHDDAGGLLPIKRTIRVIDAQNQSFREQEVRGVGVTEEGNPYRGPLCFRGWGCETLDGAYWVSLRYVCPGVRPLELRLTSE